MLQIVRALATDAVTLKEIAIASKGYWSYPDHLMSQWAQTSIITPESIAAGGTVCQLVLLPRFWTTFGFYRHSSLRVLGGVYFSMLYLKPATTARFVSNWMLNQMHDLSTSGWAAIKLAKVCRHDSASYYV